MRAAHCSAHYPTVASRGSSRSENSGNYVSLKDIVTEEVEEEQEKDRYETKLQLHIPQSPSALASPRSPGRRNSGAVRNDFSAGSLPIMAQSPGSHSLLSFSEELPHRVNLIRRMQLSARRAEVVSGATLGTGTRQHYAVYVVECILPHKGCAASVSWRIARRYSDFYRLRSDLVALERKRDRKGQLPPGTPRLQQVPFPPKRWWGNASHETMALRLPMFDKFIRAAAKLVAGEGEAFLMDQFLRVSENNRPPCAADINKRRNRHRRARSSGSGSASGSFSKRRSNSMEGRARASPQYAPPRRPSNSSDPGLVGSPSSSYQGRSFG